MAQTRIFISHSNKDEALADALVLCLRGCLVVGEGAIRCTSVQGYRLDPGSDANEALRRSLEQSKVVIGLLTPDSLASKYVIVELGAAWGLRKMTCPLLTPDVPFSALPGPLSTTHAVKLDATADLVQLVDVLSSEAGLPKMNGAGIAAAVERLVKAVKSRPS